jgi:hypothetical protein
MTPTEIQKLTKKVNVELEKINAARHTGMPLTDISAVLVNNDLDPEKVREHVHGDKGRINVQVGPEVYFSLIWERMESGNYEIIAYCTSIHDDHRDPYTTVMDASTKRKAKTKLANLLQPVTSKRQPTIASAFNQIQDAIAACGFNWVAFEEATTNIHIGDEGRFKKPLDIGNGVYFMMTWYREEGSKHGWEIVAYAS